MPLPDGDVPWPPKDTTEPRSLMEVWGAWYSGNPEQLSGVYGGGMGHNPALDLKTHPWQYSGGLRGMIGRGFWGTPPTPGQRSTRLHIPLAGDIAAVNADLLFGEAPTLKAEGSAAQERLEYLLTEGGLHAALLEGGELCSPYGGVYMRCSWNRDVAEHVIIEPIAPDCAAPEWSGQYLKAVTFWRVLSEDDDPTVIRHLERHEPGRVYHGLYEGTEDRLGRKRPLTERPETARFVGAGGVDSEGGIDTGAKRLGVEYVPNMRPHRLIRGTPLGRSDYSGSEPLMDALDEAWSSWMRDIRLAKARLVVPDAFLQNRGRGSAAFFDGEQEIFTPLHGLQGEGERFTDTISQVQFAIRVQEHSQTCTELTEQIVRGAGFSAQTFGESGDLAVTATEVQHRERRTYSTRSRKIGYWQGALGRLLETALQIDAHIFGTDLEPERPTVEWPDGVQDAPERIATTAELLQRARAASTKTLVKMVNPDWDEPQVDEEVQRIEQAERDALSRASAALVGGQREQEDTDGGTEQERAGEGGGQGQSDARQRERRPVPGEKQAGAGEGDPRRRPRPRR